MKHSQFMALWFVVVGIYLKSGPNTDLGRSVAIVYLVLSLITVFGIILNEGTN